MDNLQSRIDNIATHINTLKEDAHACEQQLIDSSVLTSKQIRDLSKRLSEAISALNQLCSLKEVYSMKLARVDVVKPSIIIP